MGLWPNTTNNLTYAKGLMECLYWGDGYGVTGPHVMADLEMGVYEGTNRNASYKGINASFVTAMVKGDSNDHWAIKARALLLAARHISLPLSDARLTLVLGCSGGMRSKVPCTRRSTASGQAAWTTIR